MSRTALRLCSIVLAAAALNGCGMSLPGSIDKDQPVAAAAKACDDYSGPALSALKAYEGPMHEHGLYSDGDPHFRPADYYKVARDNGYSYMAGSEHSDTLDNGVFVGLHASCDPSNSAFDPTQLEYCYLNVTPDRLFKWSSILDQSTAATDDNFLAIRGFEWTSDVFGHINVYFSKNFSNAKTDLGYALTMDTFWDWFQRDPNVIGLGGSPTAPVPLGGGSDGLAHFNHPHDKCLLNNIPAPMVDGVCDWNEYELIPGAVERMFGIEAYNDSNRDDRYMPYLALALDKGWRLSFIGSEDEHFGQYAIEGHPKTVTLAQGLSEADFKEAWLARRTYALSDGIHVRVDFQAEGHPMGSQMSCDAGKNVPFTVSVKDRDGKPFPGSLHLFTDGGKEIAQLDGTDGTFQVPVLEGRHWYFVRVHGADGKSAAYVAPVWISSRDAAAAN